jgi:hypothetical protein
LPPRSVFYFARPKPHSWGFILGISFLIFYRTARTLVEIWCSHCYRIGCGHVRLYGVDLPRLETL